MLNLAPHAEYLSAPLPCGTIIGIGSSKMPGIEDRRVVQSDVG